jgi:hypothetical protein
VQGALSTLVILIMSSVGGSMFPRFVMPEAMQKGGLLTINAWAIDGFTKVFWRDEPVSHLWPQVLVLLATGVVLFAIARKIAQRWEHACVDAGWAGKLPLSLANRQTAIHPYILIFKFLVATARTSPWPAQRTVARQLVWL